jgi:hypothetical protein
MQIKPESVVAWGMVVTPFMTGFLALVTILMGKSAAKKADKLAVVADKTHMLVNSQMGQQLMLYSITARTLANLTQDPKHIQAADEADRRLQEHVMKQQMVDNKEMREGAYLAK